jgi:hypothetical protein
MRKYNKVQIFNRWKARNPDDKSILDAIVLFDGKIVELPNSYEIRISTSDFLRYMHAAFREAAKDQKRLDWIEANCDMMTHQAKPGSTIYYLRVSGEQTYREWIDEQSAKYPGKTS